MDEVVQDDPAADITLRVEVALSVLEDHQSRWLRGVVQGGDVDPELP